MAKTSNDDKKRKAATERKRRSRQAAAERRAALGISRLEIELPQSVRDQLDHLRRARVVSGSLTAKANT
ncbi:hypothetical protein QYZ44_26850 [Vibrio parahaemolyticus]|nr:hypothetical protein [Vibrio parahaemolyticus]